MLMHKMFASVGLPFIHFADEEYMFHGFLQDHLLLSRNLVLGKLALRENHWGSDDHPRIFLFQDTPQLPTIFSSREVPPRAKIEYRSSLQAVPLDLLEGLADAINDFRRDSSSQLIQVPLVSITVCTFSRFPGDVTRERSVFGIEGTKPLPNLPLIVRAPAGGRRVRSFPRYVDGRCVTKTGSATDMSLPKHSRESGWSWQNATRLSLVPFRLLGVTARKTLQILLGLIYTRCNRGCHGGL